MPRSDEAATQWAGSPLAVWWRAEEDTAVREPGDSMPTTIHDPATWLDEHGDALLRYAVLRVRDRDAAEELVQETLLSALAGRDSFAGRSSERTWLISILRRKIIDFLRAASRKQTLDPTTESSDWRREWFNQHGVWKRPPPKWLLDPLVELEKREFREVVHECVGQLPETLRGAFVLRELEDLDPEEICQVLAISLSNLWARLHRARTLLRECLERKWFRPGDG